MIIKQRKDDDYCIVHANTANVTEGKKCRVLLSDTSSFVLSLKIIITINHVFIRYETTPKVSKNIS